MTPARRSSRSRAGPAAGPGGDPPWLPLEAAGHEEAANRLRAELAGGLLGDVDQVRIRRAIEAAAADVAALAAVAEQIVADGSGALVPASRPRDLPERVAEHRLEQGRVRIGVATNEPRNPSRYRRQSFALDMDVLRTSLLVVGPPGAGKTRSFALPVLEHLCLQSLAGQASVLVVDPKGDFADHNLFDIEIDLARPDAAATDWGLDLYGGAHSPEEAADRLASALIPPGTSPDKMYFVDASKNALYQCLAPWHAAYDGRYPTIPKLLALLRGDEATLRSLQGRLAARGRKSDFASSLDARANQRRRRDDPAASLIERLGLLDRPSLVRLFDPSRRRFAMRQLNDPVRVRIALPESQFPEASVILARLVVAQFVQVASAHDTNRAIFKGLVVDEAGRYVDDYVARGVQRVRSNNAGLVLLTQSLGDIPDDLRQTIFGSVGCKAVFAGLDPGDARYFADWWGTRWVTDVTVSAGRGASESETPGRYTLRGWRPGTVRHGASESQNVSLRKVERDLWSPSDIINGIPTGHALISLARSDGTRTPPILVDLRA